MPRPVTLFTGQWADMPLEQLAPLARKMGYDGVELACWGDHFEVDKALSTKRYVQEKWDLLRASGLSCQAVSKHAGEAGPLPAGDERGRPRAVRPQSASGLRRVQGQSGHGRVHHHRPALEQHRWAGMILAPNDQKFGGRWGAGPHA